MTRPRFNEDIAMDVYSMRLTPAQAIFARQFGEGNVSEGVRRMIDERKKGKVAEKLSDSKSAK